MGAGCAGGQQVGALDKIPEQRMQDPKERAGLLAKKVEVTQSLTATLCPLFASVCMQWRNRSRSVRLHTRMLSLIALDTSQDCALSAKERPASSRMFMLSDVMAAVSATR